VSSPSGDDNPVWGTCLTSDGLRIAFHDFGGDGPALLLVHATGFCAGILAPLAFHLTDQFHCWGLDLRAHGRSERPGAIGFEWSGFANDVLAVVDHLGLTRPYGFGHSCGGASVLLAEESRPGTFGALYCFEPVIFPGPPIEPIIEGNPLAMGALRRRDTFPSTTDAFINFSSKPPFDTLDPEVLKAYVDTGFEAIPPVEGGDGEAIRLLCRREDEAQVYAHGGAHGAFASLERVRCHVTLGYGAETDGFGRDVLESAASHLDSSGVDAIPGLGHFGPLQRPAVVADSMIRAFGPDADPSPL
jgi:pimeloyl-ACP methyl ester carboxylesterase